MTYKVSSGTSSLYPLTTLAVNPECRTGQAYSRTGRTIAAVEVQQTSDRSTYLIQLLREMKM